MKQTYRQLFVKKVSEKYVSILLGVFVVSLTVIFALEKNDESGIRLQEAQGKSIINIKGIYSDRNSTPSGQIDMEAAATSKVTVTTDSYKVLTGDTLSIISQKVYGDMFMWQKIVDANNIPDINNIEEGIILKIPRN